MLGGSMRAYSLTPNKWLLSILNGPPKPTYAIDYGTETDVKPYLPGSFSL